MAVLAVLTVFYAFSIHIHSGVQPCLYNSCLFQVWYLSMLCNAVVELTQGDCQVFL